MVYGRSYLVFMREVVKELKKDSCPVEESELKSLGIDIASAPAVSTLDRQVNRLFFLTFFKVNRSHVYVYNAYVSLGYWGTLSPFLFLTTAAGLYMMVLIGETRDDRIIAKQ